MARTTRAAARLLQIGTWLRAALRRVLILLAGAAPAAGFRRLAWSVGLLLLITIAGLIGYRLISEFSWFDALYQVVLTLTTVGFREVHPLDEAGRAFTVGLAVVGVTTGLYLMAAAAATLLEGDLYGDLRSWRMTRELAALEGHVIVAGAGRVGRGVISELIRRRRPFAIIDTDQREVEQHRLAGRLAVQGDASRRETLLEARLPQARALVVATGSDAQNTFITLSALGLDPQCYVVARSNEPEAAAPLRQAGAARVFTPTEIVGRQLAAASLYPSIMETAENVLELPGAPDVLLRLEVASSSAAQGLSASEALGGIDGAQLLGIRRADGQFSVGGGDQRLTRGDALLVLTTPNAVDALEQRWSRHADDSL